MKLATVAFEKSDRVGFYCANNKINAYFATGLTQDIKRGYAKCFVLRSREHGEPIDGSYTLSSLSVQLDTLPSDLRAALPRFPTVPVILLGWLARHANTKTVRVGELLLLDALKRAAAADVGAYAVIADAIDDGAVAFYKKYGFIQLDDRRCMIAMQTIAKFA